MTAIEEMAGMDILCSDKTGTLTLNKLTVDKSIIEVYSKDADQDLVLLLAARAARTENQDAIDACIVGMLADPKEAREGITEVHFFPFNPVDKRTQITYTTPDGKMYRASKGAPEQILDLAYNKNEIAARVHATIAGFAERGLRSLGVARQEVPEGVKDAAGGPWEMVGLLPLFDPPRHDSAETIKEALKLGVNVKMITGDQLAIGKETGRRLGMGTNMYPSSALLGQGKDASLIGVDVADLIEKADGFAGVFPEHKYEIVNQLQKKKHIVGMTGDGVNDAPALKKADIGIAVDDSTDAARSASDIVLTEPGLSVIIHAVLTSRCIFQRMKNYTIYAISITIRIVLGFMLIALIWKFDFAPFMVLIIAILNDGAHSCSCSIFSHSHSYSVFTSIFPPPYPPLPSPHSPTPRLLPPLLPHPSFWLLPLMQPPVLPGTIMTISKDRVLPSPTPDSWKLSEIFCQGVAFGSYLGIMSVVFFWAAYETNFFERTFGVESLQKPPNADPNGELTESQMKLMSALYLQVSIISQALIFVTRSQSFSFLERPGLLLMVAFVVAQLIATFLAVYANWGFTYIMGCGWGWAGIVWLYSLVTYIPLDFIKFAVSYMLSGKAWDLLTENRVTFTKKANFGIEERQARWATAQRTLTGLQTVAADEAPTVLAVLGTAGGADAAEAARRRAEIARLREGLTLKGHVDNIVKLKNIDVDTIQQSYTV
ncbi:unnamed protein product [Closterium sp. Naga37s-1]|nr:unnamed protein product [Closterium sp. Naga37s-1]